MARSIGIDSYILDGAAEAPPPRAKLPTIAFVPKLSEYLPQNRALWYSVNAKYRWRNVLLEGAVLHL
jgi:hypothetical protein